jgi:hypothetical protein
VVATPIAEPGKLTKEQVNYFLTDAKQQPRPGEKIPSRVESQSFKQSNYDYLVKISTTPGLP